VEWNDEWKQWLIAMRTKISAGRLRFKVLLRVEEDEGVCLGRTVGGILFKKVEREK
jgi:hypothetical protein